MSFMTFIGVGQLRREASDVIDFQCPAHCRLEQPETAPLQALRLRRY
jgi:hypothetical protein